VRYFSAPSTSGWREPIPAPRDRRNDTMSNVGRLKLARTDGAAVEKAVTDDIWIQIAAVTGLRGGNGDVQTALR